jgi:hypothetical protein
MTLDSQSTIRRREFLKLVGAAAALSVSESAFPATRNHVAIVIDTSDPAASSAPVEWAAGKLSESLSAKGATAEIVTDASKVHDQSAVILIAGDSSFLAKGFSRSAPLDSPESLRLTPGRMADSHAIWISARDIRGFVYGVLELTERVQFSTDTSLGLNLSEVIVDKTDNTVRSIARAFCSDIEDKSWYYSKEFWRGYLDILAFSRFNRFNFAFGFGYDFPKGVTGDYFHFPYPYLVDVPGYKVRVIPLDDSERARNMEMLRFIASETAARGLQFQLGIWTHAYEWTDSPHSDHHIIGLSAETHALYCRDALAMILKDCPEITGLTLRVHGESGVPEGSYPFWKTLFEAISNSGRKIEIDMHAKGINQIMIDMAADTGMPVKVSAKSWAEHMGLGYHQADIRELEIPRLERMETGTFSVSNGERRFTRYGYADLFQDGRKFDVLFRLWPGTQRHLLWGDPEMAAGYGHAANFCGAAGLEICEPLTFEGREGSGHSGDRNAYLDSSLNSVDADWKKFEYSYRLWGRKLYNPETRPEVWQRYLRQQFGAGAGSVESSLANASRVLALVTTAHLPSASNHSFWPELYDNMPIVLGSELSPYSDTPGPKVFGTVSPLDPQLFSSIAEHAQELIDSNSSGKYSPVETAQWLEDFSNVASHALTAARSQVTHRTTPEFRRMEEDVLIQIGLGRFYAAKLRSGMLYEIYQKIGNAEAGRLAISEYQKARTAWVQMAERAKGVYVSDISYGGIPMRRGHWIDRIPGIDKDLAAMAAKIKEAPTGATPSPNADKAVRAITQKPNRPYTVCAHHVPTSFSPGKPLALSLEITNSGAAPTAIHLMYRHVNQGERWKSLPMEGQSHTFGASIPADYTNSVYPVQYYFVLSTGPASGWFHPAFNKTLSNQPYYVISKRSS